MRGIIIVQCKESVGVAVPVHVHVGRAITAVNARLRKLTGRQLGAAAKNYSVSIRVRGNV
jgi:hypothetical protein